MQELKVNVVQVLLGSPTLLAVSLDLDIRALVFLMALDDRNSMSPALDN